ncbi:hypothetical protein GCM10011581_10160 [Saccharopolyspora subtropica]|uniref:Uncharacterized protein n=1 Tax=Saccharopolyspora thermophila TaxID=89367 RepID=A0A917JKV0_9PSEU|nr:hypothetical protein GCM10011581_10160 [Saccharopolyspora subtropica]
MFAQVVTRGREVGRIGAATLINPAGHAVMLGARCTRPDPRRRGGAEWGQVDAGVPRGTAGLAHCTCTLWPGGPPLARVGADVATARRPQTLEACMSGRSGEPTAVCRSNTQEVA